MDHNLKHGIVPVTIKKDVKDIMQASRAAEEQEKYEVSQENKKKFTSIKNVVEYIKELEEEMFAAAEDLNFEVAAQIRDEIKDLREEAGLIN